MEIADLLEKVQVEIFDPDAKYLIVLLTDHMLTKDVVDRLSNELRIILRDVLENIPYQVMVIDNGAKIDVFEIKQVEKV